MNPLLSRLQPYPFERLRQLCAECPHPGSRPRHQPGHRRAQAPDARVHQAGAGGRAGRPGDLSGHRRRAARCARPSPAGCSAATACRARSGDPGAAGQRLARGAVRVRADGDRPDPRGAWWSAPIRSTRSTKARRCWPARSRIYVDSDPQRNFAVGLGQRAGRRLGPHPAAVRLLAGQSDRRGDAAGRMAASCSSCPTATASSSPRTSAIQRDLLRATSRRWAALEAAARLGRSDFRNLVVVHQPVQALQRARACASGFVAGDAALLKQFLLYRTYHGSAMSPAVQQRQHRRLERRAARGARTARCTAPSSRRSLPLLAAGAGRATARRRLLPVGRRAAGERHRVRARPAALNTMSRCCPAAISRASAQRARNPGRRPRPHGAGRRDRRMRGSRAAHRPVRPVHEPNHSMTQQLQQIIDNAWENRANISAESAPPEVARGRRARHRRAEQRPAARRRAPRRAASGRCTSGSRKRCCCRSA